MRGSSFSIQSLYCDAVVYALSADVVPDVARRSLPLSGPFVLLLVCEDVLAFWIPGVLDRSEMWSQNHFGHSREIYKKMTQEEIEIIQDTEEILK